MFLIDRLTLRTILLTAVALFASCSTPLLPDMEAPESLVDLKLPNDELMAWRADWFLLGNPKTSKELRDAALIRYNERLLNLVRQMRIDLNEARENNRIYSPKGMIVKYEELGNQSLSLCKNYSDIIPSEDVDIYGLEERYVLTSFGVAMVGVIPAMEITHFEDLCPIQTKGTVHPLTAVLKFPKDISKMPTLHLIGRAANEFVHVGRMRYQLSGDLSSMLEIYWNLTNIKSWRLMGLFRPQEIRDLTGLSCIDFYDGNKIPIILTHGIASSPSTFTDLVNRLLSDSLIRKNYQFWYFGYPTGTAWTISAERYRDALARVRKRFDPHFTNKNWDNMVLVGHSMGGLITRYSQAKEPWLILKGSVHKSKEKDIFNRRFLTQPFDDDRFESFRGNYFFEPIKPGMTIFLATPHRGAPLADSFVGWLMRKSIELPKNVLEASLKLATFQEGSLFTNPEQITDWFMSVNQLSPDGDPIKQLSNLELVKSPTLSIIGDRGKGDSPDSSDGVVPYWSSHIGWGKEKIVPSGHSVQDNIETAIYLNKVLKDYLKKLKR